LLTDVDLDTYDGLDSFFLTQEIEFKSSVEIIRIGDSKCWHTELFCLIYKSLRFTEALKKRIVCMEMKMDEAHVLVKIYEKCRRQSSKSTPRRICDKMEDFIIFVPYFVLILIIWRVLGTHQKSTENLSL
jgi:hypothetical protein